MNAHQAFRVLVRTIAILPAASAVAQQAAGVVNTLQVRGGVEKFQESESYAGGAPVSGELLTGLSYEAQTDNLDLNRIGLDYHGTSDSETVCVRFTTGDGRYWALVPYEGAAEYSDPPLLDVPTRFEDRLSQYPPIDFLTLASLGDCDSWNSDEVTLVPARVGNDASPDVLLAHVNVNRGTVTAELVAEDGSTLQGRCTRPEDGARVSYSRTCRINLSRDLPGKRVTLTISVRSLVGSAKPESRTILLW